MVGARAWGTAMTKGKHNHIDDLRGASRLAVEATRGVTDLVEAMHRTIAGGPEILGRPLERPARPRSRTSGIATGVITAKATIALIANARGAPSVPASAPIASVPRGCVPMHADRMPIAPPRACAGAESSASVLCIAPKPDSAIPIANISATLTASDRDAEKATRRNGATSTAEANNRPCWRPPR